MNENEIYITKLNKDDRRQLKKLIELFNEVFEEYHSVASNEHLDKLLSKTEFLAVVAIKEGEIIGGLTAYELPRYYNDRSEFYIYDIAVKTELHNQGVGKKLIAFLKRHGKENDVETIFVEAHSEETQAVKFYESTFGKSEKVDHFNLAIE